MKNWLLMLKPDTYVDAQAHGLIGVLHMHRRRFAQVSPGDRFVAYISRSRLLDGHGTILSVPFESTSDTPVGWERYTQRARVRFDGTGASRDARELLWGLSVWGSELRTPPSNMLFCKGGFLEVPDSDYDWLRAVLNGDAPVSAKREGC